MCWQATGCDRAEGIVFGDFLTTLDVPMKIDLAEPLELMRTLVVFLGTQKWGWHISGNLQLVSVCLLYYSYSLEFNT